MFTSKNIVRYLKNVSNNPVCRDHNNNSNAKDAPVSIPQLVAKNKKSTIFAPAQKDTLFWCLYVIKNGIDKYEMLDNTHFIVEKQEKYKYIELIREKKDILKMHKIKPLSELEDDLANQDKIGIKTFIAIAILEGINVMVLQNRKLFESVNNDDKFIHMIQKTDNQTNKFFYDENPDVEKIAYYRENYFKLDTIDKKIKAMSSYKLEELLDIAKKLGISFPINEKKLSKKEIYESIILHF